MSARNVDPIIAAAQDRLRVAADLIERGRDELRAIMAALEQHPDFKSTVRVRRRLSPRDPCGPSTTLAWWLHNGTHSTLFDLDLDGAPELLREDADPVALARSLRQYIETEAADLARIARKRQTERTSRPRAAHAAGAAAVA